MLLVWRRDIDLLVKRSRRIFTSKDPEEPFMIFDLKEGGYVFVDFSEEPVSPVSIDLSRVVEAESFLQERLGRYVYKNAILTMTCARGDGSMYTHRWDARAERNRVFYGYHISHYLLLIARIYWCLERCGLVSMILRSFLDRIDDKYKVPFKEVRGYTLFREGKGFRVNPVSIKDLYEAMNTDPITGKPIEPEPALIYCMEDTCTSQINPETMNTNSET